jgi:hypothetical protein
MRQPARSLLTRGAPAAIGVQAPPGRLRDAWPFGALDVLEARWQRLGSAEVIAPPRAAHTVDGAVAQAFLARVANRAWAPRAQRSWDEQWWRDAVRMDGTETLARHHRCRAMEVLPAHQDTIEPARYVRLAHLVNLDVERIIYDTTSGHVAIEAAGQGVGAEERGAGAGRRVPRRIRRRANGPVDTGPW